MGRLNSESLGFYVGHWEAKNKKQNKKKETKKPRALLCGLAVFGRYTLWRFRQGETTLTALENEKEAIRTG